MPDQLSLKMGHLTTLIFHNLIDKDEILQDDRF